MASEERKRKARERVRKWRADNPERARALSRHHVIVDADNNRDRARKWYEANKDRKRAFDRKYRAANRARNREHQRKYRATHAERLRSAARERARKRRAENPEPLRDAMRRWRANHPEQELAANANRRAFTVPVPGHHTTADIRALYEAQRGRCAGCGAPFAKTGKHRFHVDHIAPLKPRNGGTPGSNGPENLQLLCRPCNHAKSNLSPEDWAKRIGKLFI